MGSQVRVQDGRVQLWLPWPLPGGWVCGEPVDGMSGDYHCGMPVESEPCHVHPPLPSLTPIPEKLGVLGVAAEGRGGEA